MYPSVGRNQCHGYCWRGYGKRQGRSSYRIDIVHYNDVIMSVMASQITGSRLIAHPLIQAMFKENIKAPRYWPLCGEFTGDDEFPAQKASNAENVSIWWHHHEPRNISVWSKGLTQWSLNNMVDILQTSFSNAFPGRKRLHWDQYFTEICSEGTTRQ